jgi:thioredoxin-like negative regulator of GroEL
VSSIALATATTGVVYPAPARADAALSLDGVIELTPENFARVVEAPSSGNVFVEFYAPWCPFCQRLEPIWSELPEKLRDAGVPTTIARMNVDTYTEYGEAFDVSGFPTLILFKDGVPIGQKTGLVDVQTAMRYAGVRDDGVVAKLSEKIPGGRVPPQMNLVVTSPQIDAAREELGALRKVVEGLPDERERAEAVARVKNLEGLFAKRSL